MADVFDSGTVQATETPSAALQATRDVGTSGSTAAPTAAFEAKRESTTIVNGTASFTFIFTRREEPTLVATAAITAVESITEPPATASAHAEGSTGAELRDGTVTNPGPIEVYPVTTITGPVTDPTFWNATRGTELTVFGDFVGGDTLIVDHGARTIKLNGATYTGGYRGDFWPVLPGVNTIRAGMASRGIGFTMSIAFKEARR